MHCREVYPILGDSPQGEFDSDRLPGATGFTTTSTSARIITRGALAMMSRERMVWAGFSAEVFNLLDSDDLLIATFDQSSMAGSDISRRFGRRWQLGLELHF